MALQREVDAREKPSDFNTGFVLSHPVVCYCPELIIPTFRYFPQGSRSPTEYPRNIYGTEVYEVNLALRDIAIKYAKTAKLNDSDAAIAYRSHYATNPAYKAGSQPPTVVACDVATADLSFTGKLLGDAFENTTKLFTNGSGVYCNTAQEDNATLEALLRGAIHRILDFGRIIVMRTSSDFDRPYDNEAAVTNILTKQGGSAPALKNIYLAGVKIVEGILHEWDSKFRRGIKAPNYIGDIYDSLGGKPNYGPGHPFGPASR